MRNLYLIVGVRGEFEPRAWADPSSIVEVALSQSLERWGIEPLPWGACDSGADLTSKGADVLRAWNHVDLRNHDGTHGRDDVPVTALLRGVYDTLELFGLLRLTGVNALIPTERVGPRLRQRVAGSVLRHGIRPTNDISVWLEADIADGGHWNVDDVRAALRSVVELRDPLAGASGPARYTTTAPDPFAVERIYPLQAIATASGWTIEHAAWLLEAVALSFADADVSGDVLASATVIGDVP